MSYALDVKVKTTRGEKSFADLTSEDILYDQFDNEIPIFKISQSRLKDVYRILYKAPANSTMPFHSQCSFICSRDTTLLITASGVTPSVKGNSVSWFTRCSGIMQEGDNSSINKSTEIDMELQDLDNDNEIHSTNIELDRMERNLNNQGSTSKMDYTIYSSDDDDKSWSLSQDSYESFISGCSRPASRSSSAESEVEATIMEEPFNERIQKLRNRIPCECGFIRTSSLSFPTQNDAKTFKNILCSDHYHTIDPLLMKNGDMFTCSAAQKYASPHNQKVTALKFKVLYPNASFETNLNLRIPPYYLGLWLGDGQLKSTRIVSTDIEIGDYLKQLRNAYDRLRKTGDKEIRFRANPQAKKANIEVYNYDITCDRSSQGEY